ncbi:alpha/beta-hydrolase [Ceraceosorus guamensis]|uniref:Alpha/beta-hydrolase n=1 Tax=Ceraceosorus guamensis TaxID=1522189 RepID=A0A316VME4_9BASI|nr:alpha/beta-hydrolase [Ceraceosorus guamensis]PWN38752.1 alpha/beta-hydrolase [Ceraceosorus guamensis]
MSECSCDLSLSCLYIDLRGSGGSTAPKGRYKTSELAQDVLEVLDHLGGRWIQDRSVHLVGETFGGMVALECARQCVDRWASLVLLSTHSGRSSGKGLLDTLPPWTGQRAVGQLLLLQSAGWDDAATRAALFVKTLFPKKWLDEMVEHARTHRTRRHVIIEAFQLNARNTTKVSIHAAVGRIAATMTHHIPDKDLKMIGERVPYVAIVTGDDDDVIKPCNSVHLAKVMSSAKLTVLKGVGHAAHIQSPSAIDRILKEAIASQS